MRKLKLTTRRVLALVLISLSCAAVVHRLVTTVSAEADRKEDARAGGEGETAIEAASFARAEFFGAQALVPYPTAEARNRLADVREKYPNEPQVALRLSQLDEKLGQFGEAERELSAFVELEPDKQEALTTLASFYDRRAQFEKEAATFERLLEAAPQEQRAQIFARLIELARTHGLESYLKPEFYQKYIEQGAAVFEIIEQLLDKLVEEKNYPEALAVLRQYKERYPERQSYLLNKEVSILVAMKNWKEAEGVYLKAFDPFWPRETSEEFYQFLSDHDRFRAYGHELAQAFARDPADFDTALRLIHYRDYEGERSPRVIAELERARGARHVIWKPEELATLARLLIADGDGDTASRFVYTLSAQNELKPASPLRAKVLYQLFELLSDARDQRLALTRGDLKFYEDIATSDPHPGMLGGVLSLVLSDTEPAHEFADQERRAVRYFNRSAAFRIFTTYKQEYPTSPELAQMYLDIVRLYASTGEPQVAAATLAEFEGRYADAPAFAEVAMKLADCYVRLGKTEEEHALYRRILDYLGKKRAPGSWLVPAAGHTRTNGTEATVLDVYSEPTEVKPSANYDPLASNRGIYIPSDSEEGKDAAADDYDDSRYTDYLTSFKEPAASEENVTYAEVLERYVSSLAHDKRNEDILALYANELKKYPDEQGLYEQMLQWLGQTNLFDEQLKVYKAALAKFPTTLWRDRLARWFLRRDRRQELEAYSRELLAQLNDSEAQHYLERFVGPEVYTQAPDGGAQLYLGLYQLAHERFPHNLSFVRGLLKFYAVRERWDEWRRLMAEYYFTSREIRDEFLAHLAGRNELRAHLERARERSLAPNGDARALDALPYKLFRADAAAHLANYEEAIDAYRELNRLYPNTPEFSERLISFTRSLGQHNPKFLEEAAEVSRQLADAFPASAAYRTRAGEVRAELGDYDRARGEWEQLIATARGAAETYLETATVYWDYFQYEDALRVITELRERVHDPNLYAFEAGAILEARHKTAEALAEYVKTLGSDGIDSEEIESNGRGKLRLTRLYKREGIPAELRHAVERERARRADGSSLVHDYADLLSDAGARTEAAAVLKQEIARSNSREFLDHARDILARDEDEGVSRLALERLASLPLSPRFSISYRLQLAEDSLARGRREEAADALGELVEKFPTNYGVLDEAENLYWRMGLREDSLRVLEGASRRGRGRFHYVFGRKLAARLTLMDRLPQAERVLVGLHDEDKLNTEVFHELARVYLRTSNTAGLKRAFQETLAAIKEQDLDRGELHAQVAALRGQMIDAFTRLKDYAAAVEQHIEIINREPEDEENVEAAIDYARRYGGADTLLAYYQRTANDAYKNYRWNVVLARLYEAKHDLASAAENYKAAIGNQPEMVELYDALAQIYARMNNTAGALEALSRAAELTDDDPLYVRRIVELLEKAGRRQEAEEARARLPVTAEPPPQETAASQFAEAERLKGVERSKAVAAYRQAFDTLLADPFAHELKSAEITGYVQTVREEERLDQVAARLWQLRDQLVAEAARKDSRVAGAARASLTVLDGALPEAVGGVAAERGTGDELSALFADLNRRVEDALKLPDADGTLSLLQNLCHRAGFGALEEKILVAQTSSAYETGNGDLYRQRLQGLVDFYAARGGYRQIIELMEAERGRTGDDGKAFDYLRVIASNARAVGDFEKELQALRENYRRLSSGGAANQASAPDELVARYLEALSEHGEEGRGELRELAQQASPYQLQLINFLLARGDGELAHNAIEHAPFPAAWKLSRHAGASLALADYGPQSEGYFADALQLKSVGELVSQKHAASQQPVGDDWFRLAQVYGQWLYQSRQEGEPGRGRTLLAAMIENRPQDQNEQARLGRWYLGQKDYERARAHLSLANEMSAGDVNTLADLGSAAFLAGDEGQARDIWAKIIKGERPALERCELYLHTLAAHGLAAEARERLFKIVAEELSSVSDYVVYENPDGTSTEQHKQLESLRAMIRALSESFGKGVDETGAEGAGGSQVESERAEFFYKLSEGASESIFLPKTLVDEPLVARDRLGPFYELLIRRSSPLSSYERDYDYTARLQSTWGADEAEDALDQETGYQPSAPSSRRIVWERAYLDYLIPRHEWAKARGVVKAIETEISRRYARPAWLRLAGLRLDLADGREAEALASLRRFAGVEGAKDSTVVSAPGVERLNMGVAMLREEGRADVADQLLEAAYTRELALENYSAHAFVGLARLAFERGDAGLGLKLLHMMVALSSEETRAEAAAEVASWPAVKASAADRAKQEGAEMENTLNRAEVLRLAAETASVFAQFDAAADYRRQLSEIAPEDETNRLELARVLSAKKDDEGAVRVLAEIIGDRRATRRARWQAVGLAPEIVGMKSELWGALTESVRAINANDEEMLAALAAGNGTDEAGKLIGTTEAANPNPYLTFFGTLVARKQKAEVELTGLVRTLVAGKDARVEEAFGFAEESPVRQIIRFYAVKGQPRAALLAYTLDPSLKEGGGTEGEGDDGSGGDEEEDARVDAQGKNDARYMTLRERAAARELESRREILRLLSEAAERTDDLKLAVEFERTRLKLLPAANERQAAAARIAELLARQKENSRRAVVSYSVDQNLIAQR